MAQLPMLSTDLGLLDAGVMAVYLCLTWGVAFRFHPDPVSFDLLRTPLLYHGSLSVSVVGIESMTTMS